MRKLSLHILVRELRIDWCYNLPYVFIREYRKYNLIADNGYGFAYFYSMLEESSVAWFSGGEAFRSCAQPDFLPTIGRESSGRL
jgi:hypothetical protein